MKYKYFNIIENNAVIFCIRKIIQVIFVLFLSITINAQVTGNNKENEKGGRIESSKFGNDDSIVVELLIPIKIKKIKDAELRILYFYEKGKLKEPTSISIQIVTYKVVKEDELASLRIINNKRAYYNGLRNDNGVASCCPAGKTHYGFSISYKNLMEFNNSQYIEALIDNELVVLKKEQIDKINEFINLFQ